MEIIGIKPSVKQTLQFAIRKKRAEQGQEELSNCKTPKRKYQMTKKEIEMDEKRKAANRKSAKMSRLKFAEYVQRGTRELAEQQNNNNYLIHQLRDLENEKQKYIDTLDNAGIDWKSALKPPVHSNDVLDSIETVPFQLMDDRFQEGIFLYQEPQYTATRINIISMNDFNNNNGKDINTADNVEGDWETRSTHSDQSVELDNVNLQDFDYLDQSKLSLESSDDYVVLNGFSCEAF